MKRTKKDHAIVFSGDDEERVYCSKDDYMLIPWGNDGGMVCPLCEKFYSKENTLYHHQGFGPMDSEGTGIADVVMMNDYDKKTKTSNKTQVLDKEDAAFLRPGRYYTEIQTYWPVQEQEDDY